MESRILNKKVFRLKYFVGVLLFSLLVMSCSEEKKVEHESMEDIHEKEGLPVTVEVLQSGNFEKQLSYYSTLKGVKETTAPAQAGDEIKDIKASIGDYVKEGQVIIEFPKDNPAMQYEQAKENYENLKKNYERMKKLLESGQIAQSKFDNVETQYRVAKRNFESIEQLLFVEAPISGTIISLPVRVGDLPKRDAPLFKVAQLHKMVAKVDVSEKEIGQIEKGMKARAVWNGKEFDGIVTDVPLAMDLKTRSFPVEVQLRNSKKILKSGVTVEIFIDVLNKENALTIPRSIVKEEGNSKYVYLFKDGNAAKTLIETGTSSGINIEVKSGLIAGDSIVNCCMNMLKDGIKLKNVNKGE